MKIADNIHALCSTVQSIQYSVRKEADTKQDPLALLISCSHWYCVLGQSEFSIGFVSNAYKCVGQLAYVFNVLSVCYISIILTCFGKAKSLINISVFRNLDWSDISMVTVHETEMIFPWGKTPLWICPARLWQVISKYISLCDGALCRNYQGSTSEACLRIVLEKALESSYFWITNKQINKIPLCGR